MEWPPILWHIDWSEHQNVLKPKRLSMIWVTFADWIWSEYQKFFKTLKIHFDFFTRGQNVLMFFLNFLMICNSTLQPPSFLQIKLFYLFLFFADLLLIFFASSFRSLLTQKHPKASPSKIFVFTN